eukprot:TRINITY_DN3910_c0_g1_i1.p1 TRINITY_DN3910_c0_g1~~TRINITY_DN3910_c0_g1_i1.p1  ORF type:complete len:1744 (-),score=472.34 TRINITY_DN3910_c0_g1_i1:142-4977(-)
MGLAGMFAFHPQDAFNQRPSQGTISFAPSPASSYLRQGKNVLAVQVHNFGGNTRVSTSFTLAVGGESLVSSSTTCKNFLGVLEPSGYYFDPDPVPVDVWDINPPDWLELYNNESTPIDMYDWSITDNSNIPRKWVFPAGATIGANSYLTIFTDEYDYVSAKGYFHTSFNLDWTGGDLYLYDNRLKEVARLKYPQQSPFYSYVRDSTGQYVYSSEMSPERANTVGSIATSVTDAPTFNVNGGHFNSAVTLTLNCTTPAASIYYTTDGSVPSTASTLYTGPFTVSSSSAIRAMAKASGMIESSTTTQTYLIGLPPVMQNFTSFVLTGDPRKTFYKPEGFMAINGGVYSGGLWTQSSATAFSEYNSVFIKNGEGLEKEANLAIYTNNPATSLPSTDLGVSMSSSPYSVPRFRLTYDRDLDNPNRYDCCSWDYKPSMNIYFRSQYGQNRISGNVIPVAKTLSHKDFRVRAGKNDVSNPFIMDEFARRLYYDVSSGQGVVGIICGLYVNGGLKGIYNVAQKVSTTWITTTYGLPSNADFDVLKVYQWVRGDPTYMTNMRAFIRSGTYQTNQTAWNIIKNEMLDIEAFVDYLIVNSWCGTWDWPHNNFYSVRARMPGKHGRFRFYMWDAEGCMLSDRLSYSSFVSDFIKGGITNDNYQYVIADLFTILYQSTEFKMIWADRTQKAFYNGGLMMSDNLSRRWNELVNEYQPPLTYMWSITIDQSRFNSFLSSRNSNWFSQISSYGFWPATRSPNYAPYGSVVSSGTITVTVSNPNGGGTIYYTLNGKDPRLYAGAVSSEAITLTGSTIVIDRPTLLCSRILRSNEWSPIVCASYTVLDSYTVTISELHYSPAEGSKYEFIELKNIGPKAIDMTGVAFNINNSPMYTFPERTVIQPGNFYVISGDVLAFMTATGKEPDFYYNTSLPNSGGSVTLTHFSTRSLILNFTYSNSYPWPKLADGVGFSLVPTNPNIDPKSSTFNSASSWTYSAYRYGSPYADEPTRPTFPQVLINEIKLSSLSTPSVELYNPTSSSIDISYWWISNSLTKPYKYVVNTGTVINANSYLVLDLGTDVTFSATGDDVYVFSGTGDLVVTGYYHGFTFSQINSVDLSFSRYVGSCSAEYFSRAVSTSLDASNSAPVTPQLGNIVVSSYTDSPVQMVELTSLSDTSINLANYQLQTDKSKSFFKFTDQVLPPFGKILVTGVDPATVTPPTDFTWQITGPFSAPIKVSAPQRIAIVTGNNVIDEIFTNPTSWPSSCQRRKDYWSTSNDPCGWKSCTDYGYSDVTVGYVSVLYDKNGDGVSSDGDSPIVGASICISTEWNGPSRFCLNTESNGVALFNTWKDSGLEFNKQFYARLSTVDTSVLGVVPYPVPVSSSLLSPDSKFVMATWSPTLGSNGNILFLLKNSPFQLSGSIHLLDGGTVPNAVVDIVQSGTVVGSVTTDNSGNFNIKEGDSVLTSLTSLNGISIRVDFDQQAFSLVAPNAIWLLSRGFSTAGWENDMELNAVVHPFVNTTFVRGSQTFVNLTVSYRLTPPPTTQPPSSAPSSSTSSPIGGPASPSPVDGGAPTDPSNGQTNDPIDVFGLGTGASIGIFVAIGVVALLIIIVIVVVVVVKAKGNLEVV